jgi:hypothetical protein
VAIKLQGQGMTKDEALKMAIKTAKTAIKEWQKLVDDLDGKAWRKINELEEKLDDCKDALEQPSVAELNDEYLRDTHVEGLSSAQDTHPAPSWHGLSDDEIGRLAVFDGLHHVEIPLLAKFIRAIEQALKEKNT